MRLSVPSAVLAAVVLAVTGCTGTDAGTPQAGETAAPAPASSPTPTLQTPSPPPLPAGPATAAPELPPPGPGDLRQVDWSRHSGDADCSGAQAGPAVYGELEGSDGLAAAVPFGCGAGEGLFDVVLVYAGAAGAPRLLGNALPAEERGELQGMDFRDGALVVGALGHAEPGTSGPRDAGVTGRWVRDGDGLRRTDRWVDPASVFDPHD
jgi:hypothetical protein